MDALNRKVSTTVQRNLIHPVQSVLLQHESPFGLFDETSGESWQQLSLELFLCAVCLIPYVHSLNGLPAFYDDNINYVDKRQSELDEDCRNCVMNFDSEACTRCTSRQPSIIPFYTAKRGYYVARSHPTNSNMCGCCALSRLSNSYCCENCNAFKRGG